MSKHFIVPGTDNVVDMRKYHNFRDVKKLFTGYKNRIFAMKPDEVEQERVRIKEELFKYPNHSLTAAKVQIFENTTNIKVSNE